MVLQTWEAHSSSEEHGLLSLRLSAEAFGEVDSPVNPTVLFLLKLVV